MTDLLARQDLQARPEVDLRAPRARLEQKATLAQQAPPVLKALLALQDPPAPSALQAPPGLMDRQADG